MRHAIDFFYDDVGQRKARVEISFDDLEALENVVSAVEKALRFERLYWLASTSAITAAGGLAASKTVRLPVFFSKCVQI